jgi:hypothetical protein
MGIQDAGLVHDFLFWRLIQPQRHIDRVPFTMKMTLDGPTRESFDFG